jgi:hypothetical protein
MKNRFVLVALVLATTPLYAESLEERKYWKGQMDYVQRSIDSVAEQCGVKLSYEWVDKPKLREASEKDGHTPNGICAAIVDQIESICREGEDEKKSVAAKIKGVKCGYAKERKLDMKGGIVTYMGNNNQSNFGDWARPWLLKKL